MIEIELFPKTGSFAEDKDIARKIRVREIIPALKKDNKIILNFAKIEGTTQSFIHALISEVMRSEGIEILDKIEFKSCAETVKSIINIVVDYMQDTLGITFGDSNTKIK
ncbi:MAG: DUF4325 domain-containing protein [Candidatus Omnitrophota bacterium]